jgi:hypothetical protein
MYGVMATINLLAVWGAYALPFEVEHSASCGDCSCCNSSRRRSPAQKEAQAQQKGPQKEELAQLGELATAAVVSL